MRFPIPGARLAPLVAFTLTAASLSVAGELIWEAPLASDAPGDSPTAATVRPTIPSGQADAAPATISESGPYGCAVFPYSGGPALPQPGDPYLRIFDYNSIYATGVEWDFGAVNDGYEAVCLSFDLLPQVDISGGGNLRVSVGPVTTSGSLTLNSSANRPFLVNFNNAGDILIEHSDESERVTGSFDPAQTQTISLYVNDSDLRALPVTTPDNQTETLAPNSILLYAGSQRIGASKFEDQTAERIFDTKANNLGRVSFHTISTASGIDMGLANIRIRSLHPFFPGTYPADEYRHSVLLEELFPDVTANAATLPLWERTSGTGVLPVDANGLVFDYSGGTSVNLQRYFRDGLKVYRESADQPGPWFYVRFKLTLDAAPATGASDYFFGYNNPSTLTNLRGFVWLKAGDAPGDAHLGLSTTTSGAVYADTPLLAGETHTVVVRYDLSRDDAWLWIDPAVDSEPVVSIGNADDYSYSNVAALTASFKAGRQLGRFHVDDIRAATSLKAALADGPFDTGIGARITRSSTEFTLTGNDYAGTIDFYGNLTGLTAFGDNVLNEALWDKATLGTIGDRREIGRAYAKSQTDLIMTHLDVSDESFSLFLQNNDINEDAAYVLVFDPQHLIAITTADGVHHAAPFNDATAIDCAKAVIEFDHGTLWLRGIDSLTLSDPAHTNQPIAVIELPSRALRQVDFSFGDLNLLEPSEYRVFQRSSLSQGPVRVHGRAPAGADSVEVRFTGTSEFASIPTGWQSVAWSDAAAGIFDAEFTLPAGGWYQAEVRVWADGSIVAEKTVSRFGVGEVYVAAGQSNSTNSGIIAVDKASGRVASFSGAHWQLGNDPQPGNHDSTGKGSYYSTLGDLLYARLRVPIAFASTGHGGTSVNLWLPNATYSYTDFTHARYNGLYDWTLHRIKQLGEGGFRGLLWHQGESDSSHVPGVKRTSEQDYYNRLQTVIESMRVAAGWNFPWYIATASAWPLPTENPDGDINIQTAQARLWQDGVALEGANSDTLGVAYRQVDGSRVHFVPVGLMRHAALWETKLGDRVETVTGGVNALDSDSDGLPDYWERYWGLPVEVPAAVTTDSDLDGHDDYAEFLAGSNPFDSDDFPVLDFSSTAGTLHLDYRSQAFRRYRLLQSADLTEWTLLHEAATDMTTDVQVEMEAAPQPHFYRLEWSNDLDTTNE